MAGGRVPADGPGWCAAARCRGQRPAARGRRHGAPVKNNAAKPSTVCAVTAQKRIKNMCVCHVTAELMGSL